MSILLLSRAKLGVWIHVLVLLLLKQDVFSPEDEDS